MANHTEILLTGNIKLLISIIAILLLINTITFFSLKQEINIASFIKIFYSRSDDKFENIKLYIIQFTYYTSLVLFFFIYFSVEKAS